MSAADLLVVEKLSVPTRRNAAMPRGASAFLFDLGEDNDQLALPAGTHAKRTQVERKSSWMPPVTTVVSPGVEHFRTVFPQTPFHESMTLVHLLIRGSAVDFRGIGTGSTYG